MLFFHVPLVYISDYFFLNYDTIKIVNKHGEQNNKLSGCQMQQFQYCPVLLLLVQIRKAIGRIPPLQAARFRGSCFLGVLISSNCQLDTV